MPNLEPERSRLRICQQDLATQLRKRETIAAKRIEHYGLPFM